MLFTSNSGASSPMDAIILTNILYVKSEDYGNQSSLVFYPADQENGKKIIVSGERGKVKSFYEGLGLLQYSVVLVPKNLKMEVRDV